MKSKKDWIKKLDDDSLNYLLKNKDKITKTPEKLNNKALDIIRYTKKLNYEKEKKFQFQLFFNTYKVAFVAAIIIIFIFSLTIINYIFKPLQSFNQNILFSEIVKYNGTGNIIRKGKLVALSINNKIKKGDTVKTDSDSNIIIMIGKDSKLNINEKSELKIISLNKNKKDETNKLYLSKGKIDCSINLPTKKSVLEIFTETSIFTITGTEFTLEIDPDNNIELVVNEGKVTVTHNLKNFDMHSLNKIRKKDADIYESIYKIIENKIVVEKDTNIIINKSAFEDFKKDINVFLKKTLEQLNNPDFSNSEKNKIIKTIENFTLNNKNIITFQKDDQINNEIENGEINSTDNIKEIIIKKLPSNRNLALNDKYTQVTTDNENIYIVSDKNKSIYCLDHGSGKLKWEFTNESINNITTEVKPYKNDLVFATPDAIFALHKNGTLKIKKEITGGPTYWPSFLVIDNKLLIPAFKSIYQYDGNEVTLFKEFYESNGQLYISRYLENILYIDINQKNIKEVDISSKKVIRESDKFIDRVFMPPLIFKNYIFAGDISGNLYKINYQLNNKTIIIQNINTGILSNLEYYNNYLFFVGNNGFFYKVNIDNYTESKMITRVDNNPDKDKYFTKKTLLVDKIIFYSSDMGKVFYYNIINGDNGFMKIEGNPNKNSLIGTPVKIGTKIYFIDNNGNIYYLNLADI